MDLFPLEADKDPQTHFMQDTDNLGSAQVRKRSAHFQTQDKCYEVCRYFSFWGESAVKHSGFLPDSWISRHFLQAESHLP